MIFLQEPQHCWILHSLPEILLNYVLLIPEIQHLTLHNASWFVSIDKLFEQLNVPAELQAILIRPYLSDRAKLLMSKCDPTHSAKYESIKAFLLKELHLSPAVYLEKFNSLTQDKSETYSQFSTRLMSLFDYYVESRKVSQSYDKLIDLIVYDRVKSCLSQLCHVMSCHLRLTIKMVGLAARG